MLERNKLYWISVHYVSFVYFLKKLYIFVVVLLVFNVHGKHLRSCRDGQLA